MNIYTVADLYGMDCNDLEALKLQLLNAVEIASDDATLASSVLGEKLIKRLKATLGAVRIKYSEIKGTNDEQLSELHILQGREIQAKQELNGLCNSEGLKEELLKNIDVVKATFMGIKQGKTTTR